DATVGGATFGIIAAISQGAKRGLFSNEAGMGSTPHAHALAEVKDPHEQGVVAMIGVFIDTIIVVTMTALVVLSVLYVGDGVLATGDYATLTAETITKTNIAQMAFGQFMGEGLGAWFVAICLMFFAFSTILSWNLFAKLNVEWLFGKKAVLPFTIVALLFIFAGSLLSNDLVWEMADMFNQLMVLPNAIALFALSGAVLAVANGKHDKKAIDVREEKLADEARAREHRNLK
ncbi:alanine:cation symporter family protein, partial [Parvibacter caecicola]